MTLKKYKRKRNFKNTKEPKGTIGGGLDNKPIFVIQKHAASHLHFDFRIEAGGVLKSWAVPKGLPKNGGEKRLAMMVEDHPYDYKDFEGIIPKGNYGAGTVMVWDEGKYETYENKNKKDIENEIETGIKKGKLTLLLDGKKIKGEYTLVKAPRMGKNGWLMIKKDDRFAGRKIPNENKSAKSGRTLEEIADEGTDLKNIRGAKKSKMPASLSPMLATLHQEAFDNPGWIYEIKWDGYRAVSFLYDGKVEIKSRNNKNYNQKFYPVFNDLIKIKKRMVLDGEIVAINSKGLSDFSWLQDWEQDGEGLLVYYVFDILHLGGYNLRAVKQLDRKKILKNNLPESKHVRYVDHIEKDGKRFFNEAKKRGIEGIIAKNMNSKYQAGKRSRDWLKIKWQNITEAVIGGYTEPKGSRKNMGALVLGIYDKGRLRYIGHTGGGFNEKKLREIISKLKKLDMDKCPFEVRPKTNAPVHWVKPRLVAQIKFSQWSKDGIMRQPIFLGLREDKGPSDIIGQ